MNTDTSHLPDYHIPKYRLREAQVIARRIPDILQQRGLHPSFSDWLLTQDRQLIWLFGVLALQSIARLETYTNPNLLHHLSTGLNGRTVYLSNHNGLRYAVLLSAPPRLPHRVDFPGLRRGYVLLGQQYIGSHLATRWQDLGHLLIAGKTGSGKSTLNRALAYQSLAEGHQLLLADIDGATFPMLAEHPSLLAPIAQTPEGVLDIVRRALGECEHRATLYRQMPGYPEKLDEYNTLAIHESEPPLPQIMVILDEFTAAVTAMGGAKGALANTVAELGWRGRKFGVHIILSAQDFTKAVVGRVRDQISAAICFRVRSAQVARSIGCPDAARIPESRPGLAITDRWGPLQTFYLDKAQLIQQGRGHTPNPFNQQEQMLIQWAASQNNGYLGIVNIQAQLKVGPRPARRLAEEWELRGWLRKDAAASNCRRITSDLRTLFDKVTKPSNPDKATKRTSTPKIKENAE